MLSAFAFAALVFAAASTGAIFKPGAWYDSLSKPSWTPPPWAFPVVWTILYCMIAAAGWLVWQAQGFGLAIVLWGAQLVLNAAWSWLFFGRRRMDLGFVDVCAMFVVILGFMALALPVSPLAAALFLPYAVWTATAATLNWQVWSLNPGAGATPVR
jgi:benzodiazapine receptor